MRKKIIFHIINIFFIILVQTTILDYIKINGIKPNLILVYTICFSLLEGSEDGAIIGLFAGMMLDITVGKVIGAYSLINMYTGIISGFMSKKYFKENILVVLLFTFFLTMFYEYGIYLLNRIGNLRAHSFVFVFKTVLFPEALYNSIISIFAYSLSLKAQNRLILKNEATSQF